VCASACVRERETVCASARERLCVCVSVCVCACECGRMLTLHCDMLVFSHRQRLPGVRRGGAFTILGGLDAGNGCKCGVAADSTVGEGNET
jgi:hypothetical protein